MRILVFGASGGTGTKFVEQALADGHQVTAFVRDPARAGSQHPNLTLFRGDVLDAAAVDQAVAGQDAVVSLLGPTRPPVPAMMETAAMHIVAAMQKHGVRRLISTTGAGVRDPQDRPKLFDHFMKTALTLMAGAVLRDSEANAEVIRKTDLDWTIVRFPRLTDGPFTGKYRAGYLGKDAGMRISRADGAAFILNELTEGKYIHKAPVISS